MGKTNKCLESTLELKKGPWTREEDQKLLAYIQEHGHGSWRTLPVNAGLERCGKSCRMRWTNYLRPDIKRGKFSTQEEKTIIRLHALLGNRWSAISAHLPKRTDNEIKNYWNTRLKKRLTRMGIDPVTHKPKGDPAGSQATNLSHMAQWETARLEAEARLVHKSKILYNLPLFRKSRVPPPPAPPRPAPPPCLDVLKVWQATDAPNRFFGSAGNSESPTSILNFSGNTPTVPTVCGSSFIENDVMLGKVDYVAEKGKIENSMPVSDENIANSSAYGYNMSGLTDFVSLNHMNFDIYDIASEFVGHWDDDKNYWSELLDLVSSPILDSSIFQV